MMKSHAPEVLWDHCLQLVGAIKSHTCNSIYLTGGELPETIMLGTTGDISTICQFAWYDWTVFHDTTPTFPDDTHILGQYFGPAINIGPATADNHVVYQSTL